MDLAAYRIWKRRGSTEPGRRTVRQGRAHRMATVWSSIKVHDGISPPMVREMGHTSVMPAVEAPSHQADTEIANRLRDPSDTAVSIEMIVAFTKGTEMRNATGGGESMLSSPRWKSRYCSGILLKLFLGRPRCRKAIHFSVWRGLDSDARLVDCLVVMGFSSYICAL